MNGKEHLELKKDYLNQWFYSLDLQTHQQRFNKELTTY